jgi:hypothetical protein
MPGQTYSILDWSGGSSKAALQCRDSKSLERFAAAEPALRRFHRDCLVGMPKDRMITRCTSDWSSSGACVPRTCEQ